MRILLIDADEMFRDAMKLHFEEVGCHLVALKTAKEGLEAVKKEDFDAIICDYSLPDMDGLEFFKQISGSNTEAKKILFTGNKNHEAIAASTSEAGIDSPLMKPVKIEIVEEALGQSSDHVRTIS
jgi:DNA-binding response OmpR family regulator